MLKSISDSAVAADGGSLALIVERLDGKTECFFVDRSIVSRGTAAYNEVTSDLRTLSPADSAIVAFELGQLAADTPSIHPIQEFIAALEAQASGTQL